MAYNLSARPHTVATMSITPVYSNDIMKMLEEIEREATMSPSKPRNLQKNHLKENFKRLKDIQERAKQKLAEKQPLKPVKALNKYSQVQPKISTVFNAYDRERLLSRNTESNALPRTAGPYRTQAPLSPCLSAKSEGHRSLQQYKSLPQLNPVNEEDKASLYSNNVRKKDEKEFLSSRSSHDHLAFVKNNKKCDTKAEVKHRLGHIPSYLTERKKQWELERERQIKLMEEANIPPGHTLLPDDERLETLELLKKNQDELLQSLASLPVRNDTLRLKQYKDDLEHQLAKVEEGIKIFSRPKVLIKNDS